MATRIPLPGQPFEAMNTGINTGRGLFQTMMNPVLAREQRALQEKQLEEQIRQHNNTFSIQQRQQQRLEQLQPFIIEQYKQKAALHPFIVEQYNQAAKLAPLERQYKMMQINNLVSEQAQRQFDQDLIKQFANVNPAGMNQEQPNITPPSMQQIQEGFGGQKVHPMVAARLKKTTGWDPNELSPQEKKQLELQTFREKEAIKREQKGNIDLTEITPATRTKYQGIVREINSILPVMNELVNMGGEKFTGLKSAKDVDYLRKVKRIADVYMKAKGWPNTDKARNDAIELFKRSFRESPTEYKRAMEGLKQELLDERNMGMKALSTGKVDIENDLSQEAITNQSDPLGIL